MNFCSINTDYCIQTSVYSVKQFYAHIEALFFVKIKTNPLCGQVKL